MAVAKKAGALGNLVEKVQARAEDGEDVSIGLVQKIAGQKAAGPMLLLPALVVMSPLSIIPGLPTLVGINTILISSQIVLGRDHVWLPKWMTSRSISANKAERLLKFLGVASKVADGVAKPRAEGLTTGLFRRIGAGICVLVGCIMPVLEFIPFTTTGAASIVAGFALAITARDGLLAMAWLGLVLAAVAVGVTLLT